MTGLGIYLRSLNYLFKPTANERTPTHQQGLTTNVSCHIHLLFLGILIGGNKEPADARQTISPFEPFRFVGFPSRHLFKLAPVLTDVSWCVMRRTDIHSKRPNQHSRYREKRT